MPKKAYKVCSMPMCRRLTYEYVCQNCAPEYERRRDEYNKRRQAQQEARRASSTARGYGRQWRKVRAAHMASQPLCVRCSENNLIVKGEAVDHIIPHKGDMGLFWDRSNLQTLCHSCHNRKTATEDGGFGRGVKKRDE